MSLIWAWGLRRSRRRRKVLTFAHIFSASSGRGPLRDLRPTWNLAPSALGLLALVLLSCGNVDSRRDPIRSLFSVGYLQRGTALSGEALNGLFCAGHLSLVVKRKRHFRLVGGSLDGDDFLCSINFRQRPGKGLLGPRCLAGRGHDNKEQHSNAGCT